MTQYDANLTKSDGRVRLDMTQINATVAGWWSQRVLLDDWQRAAFRRCMLEFLNSHPGWKSLRSDPDRATDPALYYICQQAGVPQDQVQSILPCAETRRVRGEVWFREQSNGKNQLTQCYTGV